MKILVLNAGSSSQKSCLYDLSNVSDLEQPSIPLWEASIDWTVSNDYGLLKIESNGQKISKNLPADNHFLGIKTMLETIIKGETKVLDELKEIDIVGHRVVHGGREYSQATLINPQVKAKIEDLIPLAPNHNPAHLEGIKAIEEILGNITQVAVFDTAFHTTIPDYAKIYPIPYEFYKRGIQRYGFHGISHEYVAQRTAQILNQPLETLNLITCHLGNGCSITAIKNGKSVNTSMGFTPLEGVMMGTRSGSIDPAILIHLLNEYQLDSNTINRVLNKESGLLGISGISGDLRAISKAIEEGNSLAKLAFDIYIHRMQSVISSMLPMLGKLDALIFTAGVGENSVSVREGVCQGLDFLGLKLDKNKNNQQCPLENIATADSTVQVLIIPTQEDWAIAKQCLQFIEKDKGQRAKGKE